MKRANKSTDSKRKRRYNLCHRLRRQGVAVGTEEHYIYATPQQEATMGKTARKYCDALCSEYHYAIQLRIE